MKKYRILSLLTAALTLFALLSAFAVPSFAEDGIVLSFVDENNAPIETLSGVHGDVVTVRVFAKGTGTSINGFQLRLTYDGEMLAPVENDAQVLLEGGYSSAVCKEGAVMFFWTDLSSVALRRGKAIAQASFTLQKSGSSQIALTLDASQGDSFYEVYDNEILDYDVEGETVGNITTCDAVLTEAAVDPAVDFHFGLFAGPTPLNEQATVAVYMKNAPVDLYGFSLEVNFDPEKLAFAEGVFSALFPYGRIVQTEAGVVRVFAATALSAPASGNADMAYLTFDIVDPDKAEGSEYELTISFYSDEPTYEYIDHQVVPVTDVPTAPAVLTLLASSAPADPFDLNGDGTSNINDVTALLDYLSGVGSAVADTATPDVNGDGFENINDVTALLDHLAE